MSRRELAEWRIYAGKNPFGPHRDNIHAAIIAATLVNVSLRKGARPRRISDFMPFIEKAARDHAAMEDSLKQAFLGIGRANRKKRKDGQRRRAHD